MHTPRPQILVSNTILQFLGKNKQTKQLFGKMTDAITGRGNMQDESHLLVAPES